MHEHLGPHLIAMARSGDVPLTIDDFQQVSSIPGAVLGALVLGWTESFCTGYLSSDYEDVFAFALLVIILIFRPAGILGKAKAQKV